MIQLKSHTVQLKALTCQYVECPALCRTVAVVSHFLEDVQVTIFTFNEGIQMVCPQRNSQLRGVIAMPLAINSV